MTYTALCTLTILGDDLSRVHRDGILRALKSLQKEDGRYLCILCPIFLYSDGDEVMKLDTATKLCYIIHHFNVLCSFFALSTGSECDMRFLYCACAIMRMLGAHGCDDTKEFEAICQARAISYIRDCVVS
jgi:geranylgeranyl transferase type-1 subunit beta